MVALFKKVLGRWPRYWFSYKNIVNPNGHHNGDAMGGGRSEKSLGGIKNEGGSRNEPIPLAG